MFLNVIRDYFKELPHARYSLVIRAEAQTVLLASLTFLLCVLVCLVVAKFYVSDFKKKLLRIR